LKGIGEIKINLPVEVVPPKVNPPVEIVPRKEIKINLPVEGN